MAKRTQLLLPAAGLMLACAGCALKESTSDSDLDHPGVVVSVSDTAKVSLDFTDMTKTVFIDSGEFDLDKTREKMNDKGLNPDSVQITGLEVTYDPATKDFLEKNKGVDFAINIYVRADGGEKELALRTPVTNTDAAKVLAFDPDHTLYLLNKEIFGVDPGFAGLLSGIRDTNKHKLMCIAELTTLETLKQAGNLRLNMVVTVASK